MTKKQSQTPCPKCDGVGKTKCPVCWQVRQQNPDLSIACPQYGCMSGWILCPTCNGTGRKIAKKVKRTTG